jgi:signal transduction histidine kinase
MACGGGPCSAEGAGEVRETLRPPLATRLRPADWIALDVVAATAYLGLFAGWVLPRASLLLSSNAAHAPGLPGRLDWVAVLLTVIPVAIRRRYPLPALGMVACGTLLVTMGGLRQAPFPALAYVLYWLALTRTRRGALAALAVALAAVAAAFASSTTLDQLSSADSAAAVPSLLFTGLTQVAAWLIGRTVRQQRAYSVGLAEQATQRARSEISAARAAVSQQRLAIARDLHDVVAHSVSLMTVQAGAARMLADSSPAESRELLAAIEATGRECLRETRHVLGVLREERPAPGGRAERASTGVSLAERPATGGRAQRLASGDRGEKLATGVGRGERAAGGGSREGDGAHHGLPGQVLAVGGERAPAPGLGELPALVARSAAAGLVVTVDVEGTRRALPATLELTAYRIIQEALTNVIKHSGADRCQVALDYGTRDLAIRVTDPGSGPRVPLADAGAGHGLIGMRERVIMVGGKFGAGPTEGGGFSVRAILPVGVLAT